VVLVVAARTVVHPAALLAAPYKLTALSRFTDSACHLLHPAVRLRLQDLVARGSGIGQASEWVVRAGRQVTLSMVATAVLEVLVLVVVAVVPETRLADAAATVATGSS
jgi:uncharacterized membrane protein YqjE